MEQFSKELDNLGGAAVRILKEGVTVKLNGVEIGTSGAAVRGEAVADPEIEAGLQRVWGMMGGNGACPIPAPAVAPVSPRAADALSEPSEPSFHVIVDEDGAPVFVTKLRHSAQEHINDACDVDVESAGKWKSVPVFETRPASNGKHAAWIDQFDNVFPLGAYQPSGKPSYLDADKRGWKPLFRAADALDSQPTSSTMNNDDLFRRAHKERDIELTHAIASKIGEFYPTAMPRDLEKNHRLARAIQTIAVRHAPALDSRASAAPAASVPQKWVDVLQELVDLIDDAADGQYEIDTFTAQPGRELLATVPQQEGSEAGNG